MRRYHIALAAVALAAASFFIFGPASDKQRFHGKPLSFWLDQLDTGTNREAATAAVRAISTNALPALLRLVGTKPTDLDEIVGALREDYDVQFAHLDAEGARARGVAGFRALGPAGLGGAPALIKLADDFQFRADAEKSLLAIGPGAVNVLIDALGHDDTKISAANALIKFGKLAAPAIPALITRLGDTNVNVREQAARSLGAIGEDPILVVPALVENLRDPQFRVRVAAMQALGRFGNRAEGAVEALLTLATNSSYEERLAAGAALKKIDPEVAASKVGPFLLGDPKLVSPVPPAPPPIYSH